MSANISMTRLAHGAALAAKTKRSWVVTPEEMQFLNLMSDDDWVEFDIRLVGFGAVYMVKPIVKIEVSGG